jgi:predicted small integral membrane protein
MILDKAGNFIGALLHTSVTNNACKPTGTRLGNLTTATGSGDIVFASITTTSDFLQ